MVFVDEFSGELVPHGLNQRFYNLPELAKCLNSHSCFTASPNGKVYLRISVSDPLKPVFEVPSANTNLGTESRSIGGNSAICIK